MGEREVLWIIDDDPIVVFGFKKMLEAEFPEMEIHSFANGKLALDAFEAARTGNRPLPSLILLDLNMPILDGWQFLEAVHQTPLNTTLHIAIITSSIDPADQERFEAFRSRTPHRLDYKNKPVKRAELVSLLQTA